MGKKIDSANTWCIRFGSKVIAECDVPSQPTESISLCHDYIFAGGRRLAAAVTDDIPNPSFEQGMEGWRTWAGDSSGSERL